MKIKQFEDKPLSHYSYAILSGDKIALIDPARNPMPYYKYAEENNAQIVAVIETHPHADFVSSHLQIHEETGAKIYVSKLVGADYPHESFDDGESFMLNDVKFTAINTPGHSPDSISVVTSIENKKALFTGDTLFIGDVGRPDLREKAGNMKAKRKDLAKQMYHTIQNKYNGLPDETLVYPAHGSGSLCGKNISGDASSGTLGNERKVNWAFKDLTEEEFVGELMNDQPFIPSYFGFDVDINKTGAANYAESIGSIPIRLNFNSFEEDIVIVDTRDEKAFKKNHFPNSINIMARGDEDKIETWLGAIIEPGEPFYVLVENLENIQKILARIAKIGYEKAVKAIATPGIEASRSMPKFDLSEFRANPDNYTIIDIRNKSEVKVKKIFENAINIPLNDLRNSLDEIPTDKPLVVHCAGGYRSAAGSSILEKELESSKVYDLSDDIKKFQ